MVKKFSLVWVTMCVAHTASAQTSTTLAQVLSEVKSAYSRQERPMVIFDIDGTLFDNRNRHLSILKEYGSKELTRARPKDAQKIEAMQLAQVAYRINDTLAAIGITEQAVINNAAVFWSQRFFNDAYLKHDKPTPGSVNFVRNLYSSGARIVYLTGRDAPRQLLGTVKALRDNGYPIGIQGTELIMKPTAQTQDAIFKQRVTNYLRHYGKVVATFDNEPSNANVYRRAFGKATVVIVRAPHTPNPPPLLPNIIPLGSFQ